MKRLLLSALTAAALTCTASAVTALPAASGGQSFYISTTLSDTAGRPADPTIYNIGGNTYFKLRDLAMAFADTRAAFQVTWDGAAQRVTLTEGVYTPVGGELAPLQGGTKPAVRAATEVYMEDMPLLGKMYRIDGDHYFKLRDLCLILGVSVAWDGETGMISIDTSKPYLQ